MSNEDMIKREDIAEPGQPRSLDDQVTHVMTLFKSGSVPKARAASIPLENLTLDEGDWEKVFKLFISVKDTARAEIVTRRFINYNPGHKIACAELLRLLYELDRIDDVWKLGKTFLAANIFASGIFALVARCEIRAKLYRDAISTARRGLFLAGETFELQMIIADAQRASCATLAARRHIGALYRSVDNKPGNLVRFAGFALWLKKRRLAEDAINRALNDRSITEYHLGEIVLMLLRLRSYNLACEALLRINISGCQNKELLQRMESASAELARKLGPSSALGDIIVFIDIRLLELEPSMPDNKAKIDTLKSSLGLAPAPRKYKPWHSILANPFPRIRNRGL